MGFPYSWVNTRCSNNDRTYTIPIPMTLVVSEIQEVPPKAQFRRPFIHFSMDDSNKPN